MSKRAPSPPPTSASASSGGTYYPPSTAPSVLSRKQKQENSSRAGGSRVEKKPEKVVVVENPTQNHHQQEQQQEQLLQQQHQPQHQHKHQHQTHQQTHQHIHNFQQQYNSNLHNTHSTHTHTHTHRSHNHSQPRQQTHQHSSADVGFFQEAPRLGNQFSQDHGFQRTLTLYVPGEYVNGLFHDLSHLGQSVVSPEILHYLEDAERHPPELESHDAFAQRSDVLRTSEGWKKLLEIGAKEGCVAEGYDGRLGRIGQFARYYLFSPSSGLVTCPFAMTDGAARLLSRHLAPPKTPPSVNLPTPAEAAHRQEQETARRVFKRAYHRLISRHPSVRWTSGQWMTERPGGSDVSRSETTAVHEPISGNEELGPWVINGYKFFSSATDADMTILLARTPNHKGLSCFYAPMKLANGDRNGVRIIRLKKKLGTKPLPTAELELKGMRAWMIGEEGEGIREIATILNVTRVHNSIMAVASMRRALNVAKAYSRVRTVAGGRILSTVPLHLRTLAQMELLTRASTHLGFLTVHLLSLSESPATALPTPLIVPSGAATALLRFLTPLTKAVTAKMCLSVISESVEALGGIGYLENEEPLNLARLLRDAQVLSIWEGTTNVLINDLVTSLKRPSKAGGEERYYSVLNDFIQENLGNGGGNVRGDVGDILERAKVMIWTEWKKIEEAIEAGSRESLTANGRRLMWSLAYVVVGTMLLVDARRDGEASAVEAVKRWVLRREIGLNGERAQKAGENGTEGDAVLVFGDKAEVHKNGQHKL
ncbi:hypothetical protein BZA77DRAFT_171499 [Pyronema omphalodes]|nr:hypothetical protein BZA77DRAFT_171499 [Pyronema omphalodes]